MGAVESVWFSDEDIAAAKGRYPRLEQQRPGIIEGDIDLHAVYGEEEIKDHFKIRITRDNPHSNYLPALYEIGGRTLAVAQQWNVVDQRDLHRNPVDGSACVCVRQAEKQEFPPGSDLLFFMERLVVPYLTGIVLFQRKGRWPWADYSHGSLGLLEYYADEVGPQSKQSITSILPTIRREKNWKDYHKQIRRPNGSKRCLCGAAKAFSRCHPRAWTGLLRLREELSRNGMNAKTIFQSPTD